MRRTDSKMRCLAILTLAIVSMCMFRPTSVALASAPASAEALWRQIGIKADPQQACPTAPDWTVRHLFGQPGDPPSAIPPELRAFCLYVCEADSSNQMHPCNTVDSDDVDDLEMALPSSMILHPDRLALAPLGDLASALNPYLAELFEQQTGRVPLPTATPPQLIQLVVVDTAPAPSARLSPLNSNHGTTLEQMANALLCTDGLPCPIANSAIEVKTQLALPYNDFDGSTLVDPDLARGGEVGFVSDLAELSVNLA